MKTRTVPALLALALGGILCAVAPAQAHKRDFVYTYQWWTPAPGEKELEPWVAYRPDEQKWEGQLELELPVTQRWSVAPYALFEKSAGEGLDVSGWKVEQRYRFGEFRSGGVLPAAYLEVKKENDEPYELEGKLLLSHYGRWNSAVNLVAEREMESGQKMEWGYAAGLSRPLASRWTLGAELHGSFSEGEHFIGPTVGFDPNAGVRILLGAGLGLNHRSAGEVQMVTEYEF